MANRVAVQTVVCSGGVMQNALLLDDLDDARASSGLDVWLNQQVPPNDGGLSLGQAALAIGAINTAASATPAAPREPRASAR